MGRANFHDSPFSCYEVAETPQQADRTTMDTTWSGLTAYSGPHTSDNSDTSKHFTTYSPYLAVLLIGNLLHQCSPQSHSLGYYAKG